MALKLWENVHLSFANYNNMKFDFTKEKIVLMIILLPFNWTPLF